MSKRQHTTWHMQAGHLLFEEHDPTPQSRFMVAVATEKQDTLLFVTQGTLTNTKELHSQSEHTHPVNHK